MKALLLIVAAVCLLSTPARAEDGWPLHVALGTYMTLNGVDLSTTMYLIGSQRGHEANPVFAPFSNRPALFGAAKMGIDTVVVYGLLRIHKTHPKLTWALTGLGIVVKTFATVHNARLLPPVPR